MYLQQILKGTKIIFNEMKRKQIFDFFSPILYASIPNDGWLEDDDRVLAAKATVGWREPGFFLLRVRMNSRKDVIPRSTPTLNGSLWPLVWSRLSYEQLDRFRCPVSYLFSCVMLRPLFFRVILCGGIKAEEKKAKKKHVETNFVEKSSHPRDSGKSFLFSKDFPLPRVIRVENVSKLFGLFKKKPTEWQWNI